VGANTNPCMMPKKFLGTNATTATSGSTNRSTPQPAASTVGTGRGEQAGIERRAVAPKIEMITPKELAEKLKVPTSWVRDQTRARASCGDMIPHHRFGRYVRFAWGSPELTEWIHRRLVSKSLWTH